MTKSVPPIDWLKAAILERMEAEGFSRDDLCKLAGVSAPTFRGMMKQNAATWDSGPRRAILKALRIRITDMPRDVQLDIAANL